MSTRGGRARQRVLLVDDEPQVLLALEDLLSEDFVVLKASSAEHALRLVEREGELAVVVSDQRMPGMGGDELLRELAQVSRATRMLVTGYADLNAVVRAVNEGRIFAYVAKPWEPHDLRTKVQRAAEHFRLAEELALERRLLGDLMEHSPDGIFFKDADLRYIRANRALLERLGVSSDEVAGKRLSELAVDHPSARQTESEERDLLAQGAPSLDVRRPGTASAAHRSYSDSMAPVRDPSGVVVGLVGISRDVTVREQAEARIARLTKVYSLISGINAAIVRAPDRDSLLAECCTIAVAKSGLSLAAVARANRETGQVKIVAREPVDSLAVRAVELDQGDGPHKSSFLGRLLHEGQPVILNDIAAAGNLRYGKAMLEDGLRSLAVFPLPCGGTLDTVFCLFADQPGFFDAEEVKLLGEVADNICFALDRFLKMERLDFLAYHDSLTGLPNRDLFLDRLGQLLAGDRPEERQLAVLIVDVGRFRHINETLGRQAGDALLVQVAERLGRAAANGGTLARLFGNTFAVIVPTVENASVVGLLIEGEILEALREGFVVQGTEVVVSARVGAALHPSDGNAAEVLLANAEAALKKAKASGQPYLFYAPAMNARVSEQLALETKLRRALEREEFLLHYQPKVNLKSGALTGLEALIRWRDPEQGLVPPGKFIPLLEETGLIREVGRWVLERAALQYHEWVKAGLVPPRIAVNVSGMQLAARDFVERLERVLQHYPTGTSGIDLEITESVFVDDLDGSIAKLAAARAHGLTVAMDDFGTGYSSLSSIGRLPLDSLKVDRSFVMRMTQDPQSTSIVTTIIALGHALDLTVVAEGVETEEEARLLRLLKCDQAQGYLIARPMPAEDVAKLFGSLLPLARQKSA